MRLTAAALPLGFALFACAAQANPTEDIAAAEAKVGHFFAALEGWDMDALRATVTDDFELVEDTVLLGIDDFIAFVTPLREQGMTGRWQLSDFRTEVAGDVAWSRFHNRGVFTMNGADTNFHWIESAVLLRQPDGTWKIDRYQSTPVSIVGPMAASRGAPADSATAS